MTVFEKAEIRTRLADAIAGHLAEFSGGIAAWKDRDTPESALTEVVLHNLQPGFCIHCGQTSQACWDTYNDRETGRSTGRWCCDDCEHYALSRRREGGISGI